MKRITFLLVVIFTTVVFFSRDGLSNLRWRWDLVQQKLDGQAEHTDWPELFRRIQPRFVPEARWRWRLIDLKLRDAIPYVKWRTLWVEARRSTHPVESLQWLVKQEKSGADPCPVGWQTPWGLIWGRKTDGPTLGYLSLERIQGIYERGNVRARPGNIVFDVGAHLGAYTRWALDRGAAKIVGFEPDPVNAVCYQRTFEQEIADGRVVLIQAAAWNEPATLQFAVTARSAQGSTVLARRTTEFLEVPAVTIDNTADELGLDRIDFVKMDIEGAERYALQGARDSIQTFSPRMVICVYHTADDPQVVPAVVLSIQPNYRIGNRKGQQVFFY